MKENIKWSENKKNSHVKKSLIEEKDGTRIFAMRGLTFFLCNFIQLWETKTYYNGEPLLLKILNLCPLYVKPIYNVSDPRG